jgi:hypothetical protein
MAFNYSPRVVTDGLVLYLDAANQYSYVSGSTSWNDISRGGNNGTLVNGPTFNSANGGSIVFDGTNDYASILDSSTLNFTTGFSCDFWVYSNSGGSPMFIHQQSGSTFGGFEIYSNSSNNILFNKNASVNLVISSASFIRNAWTYVACTANGTTANIYVNSTNIGSASAPLPDNVDGILRIGDWIGSSGYQLNGKMSIMKLYNRALSATEVLQNYNATKTRFGL